MNRLSFSLALVPVLGLFLAAVAWGASTVVIEGEIESSTGGFVFPDGSTQTSAAVGFANVVVVAKSGGDFTSIGAALAAIGTTLPAAGAGNRYLIRVAPGEYLETSFIIEAHIHLQGAGQGITVVKSAGSVLGAVRLATGTSSIRNLTIQSTGAGTVVGLRVITGSPTLSQVDIVVSGGTTNVGILSASTASPRIRHSTVTTSGGTSSIGVSVAGNSTLTDVAVNASAVSALNVAVRASGGTPTFTRVAATAIGGSDARAVDNLATLLTLIDVQATASGAGAKAVLNTDASLYTLRSVLVSDGVGVSSGSATVARSVDIIHSQVEATTALDTPDMVTTRVALTKLVGTVTTAAGGITTCVATYDAAYAAVACP